MEKTKIRNVHCDCEDWKVGFPQIVAAQTMSAMRVASIKYTGKPFKYCPWCKKPCEVNNEED